MAKDDAVLDTENPLFPSLSHPPNDSQNNDISVGRVSDDEIPLSGNITPPKLPSFKARLEGVGDRPETTKWRDIKISASDSFDDFTVPTDDPFYSSKSPPTSATKTVKLDESKTPTAALSMGEKGINASASMDFEILPDETDDEEDDVDFVDDEEHEDGSDDENGPGERREVFENDSGKPVDSEAGEHNHAETNKKPSNDNAISSPPTSPTNIEAKREWITLPVGASPVKNRRRFLFAPKSPRSSLQNSNLGSNNSSHYASTISDTTGTTVEKPKGGQRLTIMIRKMKAAKRKETRKSSDFSETPDINLVDSALEEQSSSSDESSFDDDDDWSDEESQVFEDDVDQPLDCSALQSSLPKSFLDLPPDMYDYLDSDLVSELDNQDVQTYAWEHHLFVKGLLRLLAERDLIGVEDDVLDTHNVLKMGVLRKKDTKIGWRVKYVEVRKGNLTYFDNKGNETGRTIHLRKRRCVCRTIASNKEGGQDFVFELVVDGGRRLLWTAKSEEECQGWVRAINEAMIGEADDSRDIPLDLAMYRNAIDDYQTIHSSLKEVSTRQEYLVAMNTLLYRQTSSSALRVPMKWIRDNYLKRELEEEPLNDHDRIKQVVLEFWKNLCNTPIVMNGHSVEADGIYSGERVIGALSRCILEFDKVENTKDFDQIFNSLKRSLKDDTSITPLQAVLYARNILNGALRSSSKGDIERAVEDLFQNDEVAHAELESSEPLNVYVSYAGDNFSESKPRRTENVGWIETKSKKSKKWKMRYFVLSEGVLSYFERANPRPNRLSGQMVLRDAKFKNLEGNILSVGAQNRERLLRFSDRGELIKWKSIMDDKSNDVDALMEQDLEKYEETQRDLDKIEAQKDFAKAEAEKEDEKLEAQTDLDKIEGQNNVRKEEQQGDDAYKEPMQDVASKDDILVPSRERLNTEESFANGIERVRGAGAKFLKKAALARQKAKHSLAKKRAKDGRMKAIRTGAELFIRELRGNADESETTKDMLVTSTRNLNAFETEKREPTVQAVVEMNSTFKVKSKHSISGDEPPGEESLL